MSPAAMSIISIFPFFKPTIKCLSPGTNVTLNAYPHSTVLKHVSVGLQQNIDCDLKASVICYFNSTANYLFHNFTESPLTVAKAKLSELKQTALTSVRWPWELNVRRSCGSALFSVTAKEWSSIVLLLTFVQI